MKKVSAIFGFALSAFLGLLIFSEWNSPAAENESFTTCADYAHLAEHTVTAPSNPTPVNGNTSQAFTPIVTWNPSICNQGHTVTYQFYYNFSQADIFNSVGHDCESNLYYKFYGLMSKTKYYWGVKAVCSGGVSTNSPGWNFTTVASEIVTPPTGTSPADKSIDQSLSPIFTWKPATCNVNHALTYTLYYSKINDPFATYGIECRDATSKLVSKLEEGVTYYWGVKVDCAGGVSATTPIMSFTTMIKDVLSAPELSVPADGASNQLLAPTFKWNEAKCKKGHAVTYTLYYDIAEHPLAVPGIASKTTSTSITGLSTSSKYYWRVKAVCTGGEETSSETHSFTTTPEALSTPVLASPAKNASINNKVVTCKWTAVVDPKEHAVNYCLFYGTKPDAIETGTKISCGPETVATIDNLSYDSTYYWAILAECSNGAIIRSEEWQFKTVTPSIETYTLNLRMSSLIKTDMNKYEFRESQQARLGSVIRLDASGTLGRCQDKSLDVYIAVYYGKSGLAYYSKSPDGAQFLPSATPKTFLSDWTPGDFDWTTLLEGGIPIGTEGQTLVGKLYFKVWLVPPDKNLKDLQPLATVTLDVQSDLNEMTPGASLSTNIGNMKYLQTAAPNPNNTWENFDLWMQCFRIKNVKNGDRIQLKIQIPAEHPLRKDKLHYASVKFQRLSLAADIDVTLTALNGNKSTLITQGTAKDSVSFGNFSPDGGNVLDTLEINLDVKSLGVNSNYEDLIFIVSLSDCQQANADLLDWSRQTLEAVVTKHLGALSDILDTGL